MRMKRIIAGAALACLGLASQAASAEAQTFEPNDSFLQATGPMVGGRDYDAGIETSNDKDWYYFNTAGQRQLDISASELASGCYGLTLYDTDGDQITSGSFSGGANSMARILYTSAASQQFAIEVRGGTGCQYRLRVNPPDAITQVAPGVVVRVGPGREADDVQTVLLNGQPVASATGENSQSVSLGLLPPNAEVTFQAENRSGDWSWDFAMTTQTQRQLTTVFTEGQRGGDSESPKVGVVRRAVLTPSGGVLSSCGEALAPASCIAPPSPPPAAVTVPVPAAAPKKRISSAITISRRRVGRARRYVGRVQTERACLRNRSVILRRAGSGNRRFATARTGADGRFTLRRSSRLRGRVYAVVAARSQGKTTTCLSSASRRVRG